MRQWFSTLLCSDSLREPVRVTDAWPYPALKINKYLLSIFFCVCVCVPGTILFTRNMRLAKKTKFPAFVELIL